MSSIDIPTKYHPTTTFLPLTDEGLKLQGEYLFLRKLDPGLLREKIRSGYFPNSRLLTDEEVAEKRMYFKKYTRSKRLKEAGL